MLLLAGRDIAEDPQPPQIIQGDVDIVGQLLLFAHVLECVALCCAE